VRFHVELIFGVATKRLIDDVEYAKLSLTGI
jgi:hypothetical protein